MPDIILGVPSSILSLNQKGLIERAFHDGLFPNLAFRAEAMPEEWPANTGTQQFQTRPGLLTPRVKPIAPGTDPQGQSVTYEQWVAQLAQYADSVDTHIPTSVTSSANMFLRNIKQLGLQAGQSVNRVSRNALFQAYLSGQTVTIGTLVSGATQVRVAALSGFTDVVIPGGNVAPQTVSSAYPLPITIGTGTASFSNTVIGYIPDDQDDTNGPGTLTLGTAISAGQATTTVRLTVKSAYAPRVVRSAPGDSVDAIGPGDSITLQQCINAVAFLRRASVQPHDDGFFHAHLSSLGNAQFFADPVFQRLNQSLPEHVIYKQGFIGTISGIMFIMNNEAPEEYNSGNLVATSGLGYYADELGGEVANGSGVQIGRVLITGKGSIYERYLDESQYVTEAGTLGKIGEFNVQNNGLQILTERIRLILRAPMDKLQQTVTTSWSISTSFPTPSDITAPSGPERYKRAIICEFASG
jgi:hypothetical protein